MELLLLSDKLLSIEVHSRLLPRELGAGPIPAEDGNKGAYTSEAKEFMLGVKSPTESFVPIHLALSMELR